MQLWVDSRNAGQGDVAAFDALWARHHDAIYGHVVRILGLHRSFADEIFQDTWMEVIRTDHFAAGSFRGFIRTIATNKALDRLTGATLKMVHSSECAPEDADEIRTSASFTDPVTVIEARETLGLLLELAEKMVPVLKVAWRLRYCEGLTYEQIAEAMRCKLGTAKSRVRLANEALCRSLVARGIDPVNLGKERR